MGYQKFIQKFRSSHGVSKVQKFRSWEVQKFSWGIKSSDVQEFHKFHIFRSSQKFRSSGVQKFRSSTSSQLLGGLNSSYLDVDLTNNDTVKNRASTHAVEKRFLKKVQSKEAKRFHHRAAFWKLSKMTTNRVLRIKLGIQRKPADRTSRPNFVARLLWNLQRFTKMHESFVKIYLSGRPSLK